MREKNRFNWLCFGSVRCRVADGCVLLFFFIACSFTDLVLVYKNNLLGRSFFCRCFFLCKTSFFSEILSRVVLCLCAIVSRCIYFKHRHYFQIDSQNCALSKILPKQYHQQQMQEIDWVNFVSKFSIKVNRTHLIAAKLDFCVEEQNPVGTCTNRRAFEISLVTEFCFYKIKNNSCIVYVLQFWRRKKNCWLHPGYSRDKITIDETGIETKVTGFNKQRQKIDMWKKRDRHGYTFRSKARKHVFYRLA